MTAQKTLQEDLFVSSFSLPETEPIESLRKLRARFYERASIMGLPDNSHENYQYVSLQPLKTTLYKRAENVPIEKTALQIVPECAESHLVFVNGYFRQELSCTTALPKGAIVLPIASGFKSYSTLLTNRFTRFLKEEKDPFALLNGAVFQDGLFVYLPPKVKLKAPLQILSVIDTSQDATWVMPRLYLFAGKQTEATIVTSTQSIRGKDYLYNALYDFELEEQVQLKIVQIDFQSESSHALAFDAFRATLKRSSELQTVQMGDSSCRRTDWHVALQADGAEATLSGGWFLDGQKECHTNVCIEHQAPHTRSLQLFKGVLEKSSRSSFQGKILVQKAAQKTEAYQLNNNLILSDSAKAFSKPNLEIFADDVKASHGSTVGQLDQDQLFYLVTRGLSPKDAKSILIRGFCEELLSRIGIPSIYSLAEKRLAQFCEAVQ